MNDAPQNSDFALSGPAAGGGRVPPRSVPAASTAPASTPAVQALWVISFVLLVLCLGAGFLAWRTQQRVQNLEQELVKRQQDSAGQATEARVLSKAAEDSAREAAAKVAVLEARLADVSAQRGQLDDVIAQVSRSRDDSVVSDMDSSVRIATQQMFLTGSVEPLVTVLHQVDDRLARMNQPRFEGVRRALAHDLVKLRGVSAVNVASLSLRLDELVRVVDELPLLSSAEARQMEAQSSAQPSASGLPQTPPATRRSAARAASQAASDSLANSTSARWHVAWNSFWSQVWSEARSLIRVTRIDHPEAMLIAPEHAYYLRENLKLRLLNARLAVLSRQFDSAQADLQAVQAALSRYFDPSSRRVSAAVEAVSLAAVQARQVSLPRPEETLTAITALLPAR